MIVVPPTQITDAMLVNSTIPEPDPSAGEVLWNAATSYKQGDVVCRTQTHRRYEYIPVEASVSSTPPENDPKKWLDLGATNKWAAFDFMRSAGSESANTISFSINPGKRVDTIGLVGLQAEHVLITITVAGNEVYRYESNMTTRNTVSWYTYFFGSFGYVPSVLRQDLPPYVGATINVTLTNPVESVKIGSCILGRKVYLGATQYNARSDSMNFSIIDRDDFGNATLKPRRSVPKTNQTLWTPKEMVNQVREVRKDLNAVPALWSGLDDQFDDPYFESLLILGIYKQFEIDLAKPKVAMVSLELEEI